MELQQLITFKNEVTTKDEDKVVDTKPPVESPIKIELFDRKEEVSTIVAPKNHHQPEKSKVLIKIGNIKSADSILEQKDKQQASVKVWSGSSLNQRGTSVNPPLNFNDKTKNLDDFSMLGVTKESVIQLQ